MKDYEINSSTLAIVPIDEETSKVYEEEAEYIVNRSSNSIIKDSCEFYGSTYNGRCTGTKSLTGIKSKYPIIIEESRNIIFFPTTSVRTQQSCWIALINFDISYYSLENQIVRSTMLKSKLYERKLEEKG